MIRKHLGRGSVHPFVKVSSIVAVLVVSIVTTVAANAASGRRVTAASVVGTPTHVVGNPSDRSAIATWTAPAQTPTTPPVDSYDVTCTATENADDTVTVNVPGTETAAQIVGLTNGTEYTCAVRAHSGDAVGVYSDPSAPFTPSDMAVAQFVDPNAGGKVNLTPGQDSLGTSGQFVIPPQPATSTALAASSDPLIVVASLFGTPGEIDISCGGNRCVGQGIEWSITNPTPLLGVMKVTFFESPALTQGENVKTANIYKDDTLLPNCGRKIRIMCVSERKSTEGGGAKFTIKVNFEDPHGRH